MSVSIADKVKHNSLGKPVLQSVCSWAYAGEILSAGLLSVRRYAGVDSNPALKISPVCSPPN
jgi:hypothetical protein